MRRPIMSWPASYRGRIALLMAIALIVVTVGVQGVIRGIVNDRVRAAAERTLQAQALALAETVDAAPEPAKRDAAADAARYLPDTRIEVTWPSPGGLYYNLERLEDAQAVARSGDVEVRLQRDSAAGGLAGWLVVALFVGGLAATAGVIWGFATALSRRLRRQAGDLAASAEAVASGDLSARADETDDELGRAACAFNRMADRLAEADQRQRRFLADVAHELRTPATAIEGFAESLTDGVAATDADRREAITFIREEAARLRGLIAELRELTALDLDSAPRPQRFDLAEAARASVARSAPAASAAGVRLEGPGGALPVESDPAHVETILANLIGNAIAATPPGERIDVRVGRAGSNAWLAVADTGVGIADEHLPFIFDRLYRVDTARSREDGGSGLGLAIVRSLAERLGGSATVESTPGRGATFTVRLPGAAIGTGAPVAPPGRPAGRE